METSNLPDSIKTYPDLNMVALKQGKHKELRLWYLLHALDEKGGGRVMKDAAQKALEGIMSYEVFRTTLLDGQGDFWEVRRRKESKGGGELIELRGLPKVAMALEVARLRKDPVLIPLDAFPKMDEFRAFLFGSFFTHSEGKEPNPISRETLKQLSGLSVPTQVKYDKTAGTEVTKNVGVVGPSGGIPPSDMQAEGYYITEVDGQLQLCKRMPNSYSSDLPRAPRGRMKKANQKLAACRNEGRETVTERRYFRDPRSLLRSKNRIRTPYLQTGFFGEVVLWEEQCFDVF